MTPIHRLARALAAPSAVALALGCSLFSNDGDAPGDDDDDDTTELRDLGRGIACGPSRVCRAGLVCRGTCEPPGDRPAGALCQQTDDCADGLWCSARRECVAAGAGAAGDRCDGTAECAKGLLCVPEDVLYGRCRPAGDVDLGGVCGTTAECFAGLACLPDPGGVFRCLEPVGAVTDDPPFVPPTWAGAACPDLSAAPPVALFRVPRGGAGDLDFHALPFPSDARRTPEGALDLSGHPTPGTVLPIDVVDRYLRTAEADLDGFSTNPTVWFRFSRPFVRFDEAGGIANPDSICSGTAPCIPRFRWVDLDSPAAPPLPFAWLVTSGPLTRYACDDWLGVRPLLGQPLRPGRTYAVLLERGVTTAEGDVPFERDADFEAMLGAARPADDALARAWDAHAPLRAWLSTNGVSGDLLLSAAVFTTQTFDDVVPGLRAAVEAAEPPRPSDLTRCEAGVTSPCDDGGARACPAARDDLVELHGRLDLLRFQEGTLPFETPEDGGALARDGEGRPTAVGRAPVCFALTLPRTPAPPGGRPVLVYLHGTGGSFRSGVETGLAAAVAASPGAAVLAIDLPMHGDRRGGSARPEDELFFNFVNPRAARDNVLQGTADLFSILRAVDAWSVPAGASPTGEAIALDASRVVVFAHSQGATHAALALPWEPRVRAAVLSGLGGDLVRSLLRKTEPVDIAGILPFALLDAGADGTLRAGEFHPALSLFQMVMDRVDPVNYGRLLVAAPATPAPPPHLFVTYGLGDTFSPEPTMQAFAVSARTPIVASCPGEGACFALAPIRPLPEVPPPVSANVGSGADARTFGLRQYDPPAGVDGHFVAWRSEQGLADTLRFVREALAGEVPPIGEAP